MGRHRKYFTKEEKAAANRAKSKRHYEKTKEKTNRERRKIHRREMKKRKSESSQSQEPLKSPPPQQAEEIWLEQVLRVQRRYLRHIGGSVETYMEDLCSQFMATENLDELRDHTTALSTFQGSLYRFQSEILQLEGLGGSWLKADVIVKEVCCTLSWVEEIYCAALIDPQEVRSEYVKRRFLYQRAK